jgi:guanylate kinase
MRGVLSIKKVPELDRVAKYIFVMAPSMADLKQRLIERGETQESMDNRIKAAEWEVQLSKEKGNDQQ